MFPLNGRVWEAVVRGHKRTNSQKRPFVLVGQVTKVDDDVDIFEVAELIISDLRENIDVDHVDEFIFRIASFEESKEVTGNDDDDRLQAH